MSFKKMYFNVEDPDHSVRIQKALFELGYIWSSGSTEVMHTGSVQLLTYEDGNIAHGGGTNYAEGRQEWRGCKRKLEDILPKKENTMTETTPDGKSAHEPGAKLDAGKAPVRRGLLEYFPRACLAIAQVSASGAKKYAWNGWESVENGIDRYGDAEVRHICKSVIEGEVDKDFGHLHMAHEAWNSLARLELILREKQANGEWKP